MWTVAMIPIIAGFVSSKIRQILHSAQFWFESVGFIPV